MRWAPFNYFFGSKAGPNQSPRRRGPSGSNEGHSPPRSHSSQVPSKQDVATSASSLKKSTSPRPPRHSAYVSRSSNSPRSSHNSRSSNSPRSSNIYRSPNNDQQPQVISVYDDSPGAISPRTIPAIKKHGFPAVKRASAVPSTARKATTNHVQFTSDTISPKSTHPPYRSPPPSSPQVFCAVKLTKSPQGLRHSLSNGILRPERKMEPRRGSRKRTPIKFFDGALLSPVRKKSRTPAPPKKRKVSDTDFEPETDVELQPAKKPATSTSSKTSIKKELTPKKRNITKKNGARLPKNADTFLQTLGSPRRLRGAKAANEAGKVFSPEMAGTKKAHSKTVTMKPTASATKVTKAKEPSKATKNKTSVLTASSMKDVKAIQPGKQANAKTAISSTPRSEKVTRKAPFNGEISVPMPRTGKAKAIPSTNILGSPPQTRSKTRVAFKQAQPQTKQTQPCRVEKRTPATRAANFAAANQAQIRGRSRTRGPSSAKSRKSNATVDRAYSPETSPTSALGHKKKKAKRSKDPAYKPPLHSPAEADDELSNPLSSAKPRKSSAKRTAKANSRTAKPPSPIKYTAWSGIRLPVTGTLRDELLRKSRGRAESPESDILERNRRASDENEKGKKPLGLRTISKGKGKSPFQDEQLRLGVNGVEDSVVEKHKVKASNWHYRDGPQSARSFGMGSDSDSDDDPLLKEVPAFAWKNGSHHGWKAGYIFEDED